MWLRAARRWTTICDACAIASTVRALAGQARPARGRPARSGSFPGTSICWSCWSTSAHRAVTRDEIFDRVWADVVVSDGALSQAVRTIRRTLGDGPQAPQFIRTVSRHGYQFVCEQVRVEPDEGPLGPVAEPPARAGACEDRRRPLRPAAGCPAATGAARVGHRGGALRRGRRAARARHRRGAAGDWTLEQGHEEARAILRDARWDAPGAGDVPLLSRARPHPGDLSTSSRSVFVMPRRSLPRAGCRRWPAGQSRERSRASSAALRLRSCAGRVDSGLLLSLTVIGTLAGALGAAGIGGGLAFAEALARSARAAALAAGRRPRRADRRLARPSGRPRAARRRLRSRRPGAGRRARRPRARRRARPGLRRRDAASGRKAAWPRLAARARTRAALITGVVTAVAGDRAHRRPDGGWSRPVSI